MRPVILCGGVGTKMWPLSRRSMPKHFLPLIGGQSLFQLNVQALLTKFSPDQIFVQTNPKQAKIAQGQAPEIPLKNYLLEPEMRNQGPATGIMAARLFHLNPDEPFFLVQSDVLRQPTDKFIAMVEQVEKLILKEKKLVTGGIRPQYAIMGVDYLMAEKKVAGTGGINIYQMSRWLGRDNKEEVKKFLKKKAIFAHANHYAWTPRLMLEAYRQHAPDWHRSLQNIIACLGEKDEGTTIKTEYGKMIPGPAERVTTKVLKDGFVVELPFDWIDFGTWESVAQYTKKETNSQYLPIKSRGCFVRSKDKKFIATVGVDDLIVIDTPDALLVCRKDQSGQVGEIVDRLKERSRDDLL